MRRCMEHRTELICCAGFMRMLTGGFIDRWRDRQLNIHPSLLPAFPGLDTHERAVDAGVRIAGCTVHFMRLEMDAARSSLRRQCRCFRATPPTN